ncbi:MAG: cupin domain-containing protein [Terracidiphilus sp.]
MRRILLALAIPGLGCAIAFAQTTNTNPLATARVFSFDDMTAKTAPNGSVGRHVFTGTLATGESVAVHETTQPAGTVPNPAHRIQHSEVIVVEEGTLEFDHDGKAERAGVGGIIYVALGTLHAVKNVGSGPARYVVIAIGGDVKK